MKKRQITGSLLLLLLLSLLCITGCSSQQDAADDPSASNGEAEILQGNWMAGGLYKDDIIYMENVIDLRDVDALEDLYDVYHLIFHEDGTFSETTPVLYSGEYQPVDGASDSYVLHYQTVTSIKDGETVTEDYTGDRVRIAVVLDENTIRVNDYDRLMEKESADGTPILYVREGCESEYIAAHHFRLNGGSQEVPAETPEPENSLPAPAASSYQEILDRYVEIMEDRVGGLVAEYNREAVGVSDMEALAELCNDKIGVLSEICNDGVREMAEFMLENGDDYSVYEDWAGKLMDQYTQIADAITDAYINSCM